MKKTCIILATVILTGCGASADSTVIEKVSVGKISKIGTIHSSGEARFGPAVSTTTGLTVFFQNPTPVEVGQDAALVTEKYKSGMIIQKLCYGTICAKLQGITF